MEKIILFFKNDFWGLVTLGIITSIISSLLYDYLKVKYKLVDQKYRHRRFVKRLTKMGEAFITGARSGTAQVGTTMQQVVFVGDFIIKIIIQVAWLFFYLALLLITLIVIENIFRWLAVIVFTFIVTFRYKKIKRFLEMFDNVLKTAYGEEYFKREEKGLVEYWDSVFKEKTIPSKEG